MPGASLALFTGVGQRTDVTSALDEPTYPAQRLPYSRKPKAEDAANCRSAHLATGR